MKIQPSYLFDTVLDFSFANGAQSLHISFLIQTRLVGESNIMDRELDGLGFTVKHIVIMHLFLTNMHLVTSQDINWWTGAVWIIYGLNCFWTQLLIALMHCRGSIGEQVMWCYISPNLFQRRNKLICFLDDVRVGTFSVDFCFWVNYSFRTTDLREFLVTTYQL